MKKALVVLGILAVVAMANAEIRIFFTASTAAPGLTNSANAFKPSTAIASDDNGDPGQGATYNNNLDYYSGDFAVSSFPSYSTAVPTINKDLGQFVYIWLQFFNTTEEPNSEKVQQLQVNINKIGFDNYVEKPEPLDPNTWVVHAAPLGTVDKIAWYACNDKASFASNQKRWEGYGDETVNYDPLDKNKALMTAILSEGISNTTGDQPWDLYHGTAGGTGPQDRRIALLGAVRPDSTGTFTGYIGFTVDMDFGCIIKDSGPRNPVMGQFVVTPEPASLVLIGLAGLLIRRR